MSAVTVVQAVISSLESEMMLYGSRTKAFSSVMMQKPLKVEAYEP